MYIHYYDNQIRIEWTIYRGLTKTTEDFRRATLVCMLVTEGNRFPVVPEVVSDDDSAYLSIVVPTGLPEGSYDLLAVWTKNGGRSVARSMRQRVFMVTADQEEATDHGGASLETVLKFSSSVGTYGYDGLSAYELALLKGLTTKDETSWVEDQIEAATGRIESAKTAALDLIHSDRDAALTEISGERGEALSAMNTAREAGVGEINQKVSQGLDSVDAGITEAEAAITQMRTSAVSGAQGQIADAKEGALTEIGDTKRGAVYDITNQKGYAMDDIAEALQAALDAIEEAKRKAIDDIGVAAP